MSVGGLGEARCADRHSRAGRASKIADFWSGSETGKSAGTEKIIVRFFGDLLASKKTLVNFICSPPTFINRRTELQKIKGIGKELLTVQGLAPGPKGDGTTRLALENLNGLSTRIAGNSKLEKTKELIDEMELDVHSLVEHHINPRHKQNKMDWPKCLNRGTQR